jgi:hypothetical protein
MDADQQIDAFLEVSGWPYMVLVEDDMTISVNTGTYADVWAEVLERYEDGTLHE